MTRRYPVNEYRSRINITKCGWMYKNWRWRPIINPNTIRFSTQRHACSSMQQNRNSKRISKWSHYPLIRLLACKYAINSSTRTLFCIEIKTHRVQFSAEPSEPLLVLPIFFALPTLIDISHRRVFVQRIYSQPDFQQEISDQLVVIAPNMPIGTSPMMIFL